jgi:geranylgeranyl diphosphate synthase type I
MTQTEDISATLDRFARVIEQTIRAELSTGLDEWMQGALGYHFGWVDRDFKPITGGNSGKKLRPVMALLSYQGALEILQAGSAEEADLDPALPLAAALEMIHNYSLIHDDIEDGDRTRHGRETLWSVWGMPKAINAGDCLDMLAFRSLFRSLDKGVPAERVIEVARIVTETSVKLTLGQHADMSFEDNLDVTPEMYLKMIGGKSAALISCSTYSGALIALDPVEPANRERLENFARFGEQIGLGFQIRDDILGIWGLTAKTGKPSGSDIRRRKKSLPVLYALSSATPALKEELLTLYRSAEPVTLEQEQFVMQALETTGAREFSQQQADKFKKVALDALTTAAGGPEALAGNPPLRRLKELSAFLVERDY